MLNGLRLGQLISAGAIIESGQEPDSHQRALCKARAHRAMGDHGLALAPILPMTSARQPLPL
ncbi:hypothetical protein NOVOSPHI9U_410001 [Novosphingobium sp. 9U]|nr:hypothetical protein NOVOSPHI9U_410001 [Novosphingobium sp. 9U]